MKREQIPSALQKKIRDRYITPERVSSSHPKSRWNNNDNVQASHHAGSLHILHPLLFIIMIVVALAWSVEKGWGRDGSDLG